METTGQTYVLLARVPAAGVADFDAYEQAVLPLLAEHGARVDLRLRAAGGRLELHVLWFPSDSAFEAYLADPRRAGHRPLLLASDAAIELFPLEPAGSGPPQAATWA